MGFTKEKKYSDLSRFARNPEDNTINEKTNVLVIGSTGSGKTTLLRDILLEKTNTKKFIIEIQDEKNDSFIDIVKDSKNNITSYMIDIKKEEFLNNFINFINTIKNTSGDKVLVLDEFHFFLNNKDLKNEINKLLRESRKIDLSVIISIQEQENTILNSGLFDGFSEVIKL